MVSTAPTVRLGLQVSLVPQDPKEDPLGLRVSKVSPAQPDLRVSLETLVDLQDQRARAV